MPRAITVQGRPYDCARQTRRCWLVAASANDFNDSGGIPISFRPGLPTVTPVAKTVRPQTRHLPISAVPAGPIRSGTNLVASASGFVPGEPVVVGWCSDRFEALGPKACDPGSNAVAGIALMFHVLSAVTDHADQLGRFTADVSVPGTVVPYGAGPIECASGPGKCVLVVAAAADTERSAVFPVTLTS